MEQNENGHANSIEIHLSECKPTSYLIMKYIYF